MPDYAVKNGLAKEVGGVDRDSCACSPMPSARLPVATQAPHCPRQNSALSKGEAKSSGIGPSCLGKDGVVRESKR